VEGYKRTAGVFHASGKLLDLLVSLLGGCQVPNPFVLKAKDAGAEFARNNPRATELQIEAAALHYSRFDPCNRAFTDAARWTITGPRLARMNKRA
jgi:hypothetical protein